MLFFYSNLPVVPLVPFFPTRLPGHLRSFAAETPSCSPLLYSAKATQDFPDCDISSMQPRAVSCGSQPLLLQLVLISMTSTFGSVLRSKSDIQAEKGKELGKRVVDKMKIEGWEEDEIKMEGWEEDEMEEWEEEEMLQMSAKFSSRHFIRRVKRDDGYHTVWNTI